MNYSKRIILLLISSFQLTVCLANLYYPGHPPMEKDKIVVEQLLPTQSGPAYLQTNGSNAYFIAAREKLNRAGHKPDDFRYMSDLAFYNMQLGDTALARTALETLYQKYPNEYNIILNLSLLSEKAGDYPRALELARKAFVVFPDANYGSGWIHLRIQEFRNGLRKPATEIIRLNNSDSFPTWIENKTIGLPVSADSLLLQLAWQLHIRSGLFPVPDSINAQLYMDFADIVAKTSTRTLAAPFYEVALAYAPANKDLIKSRLALMTASGKEVNKTFQWASLIWAIPVGLVLIALIGNVINSRKKKA